MTLTKLHITCQHLEFCNTKSDSICPVYTLTIRIKKAELITTPLR